MGGETLLSGEKFSHRGGPSEGESVILSVGQRRGGGTSVGGVRGQEKRMSLIIASMGDGRKEGGLFPRGGRILRGGKESGIHGNLVWRGGGEIRGSLVLGESRA